MKLFSDGSAPHRGILINRIPFTGFPGLIFAVGVCAIFLIAFPQLVLFLALTAGLGILAGLLLYRFNS